MPVTIAPDNNAFDDYYARLDALKKGLSLTTEGNTRRAFSALLDKTSAVRKWTLAEEVSQQRAGQRNIRLDGVLFDAYSRPRGYWEAKDSADDLEAEIHKKGAKDYPISNIIFEDTERAILIQDGVRVLDVDVRKRADLANLLTRFYNFDLEPFQEFDKAVAYFSQVIPQIGQQLAQKIATAHKTNKTFQAEFAAFMDLCRTSLNPNMSESAVDEMLIQHLLTERLIRNLFQSDFVQRNVIAKKVEDVISALTKPLFDRNEFQEQLAPFYTAIENTAQTLSTDYQSKQRFINTVYEQFFQGYSVKVADTHGIVYTPQEIVDFMCAAVEEVLQDEFGKKLGQDGVTVLDPATGTGNFIINLLNRVDPRYRRDFYKNHLFANEVMLMPYYIAALNIEHAYYELEGQYEPFEGLCFVDTLDLAKKKQLQFSFMTEANTERVQRQQEADITVIIGNPPYNVGQQNEMDNNKNRAYEVIDARLKETYVSDSSATLRAQLYDPYVKFFRWATDRLGDRDGVVCFVSNNSFVEDKVFDGMRKHLQSDFNRIYIVDLKGNVRKDSMREGFPIGEEHTVFGLAAMVGISITVLVKNSKYTDTQIHYAACDWKAKRQEKFAWLNAAKNLRGLNIRPLESNYRFDWLVDETFEEFDNYIPMGTNDARKWRVTNPQVIFKLYANGTKTNRDAVVFDYDKPSLLNRLELFAEHYNRTIDVYKRKEVKDIDEFVDYEYVKWSRNLKRNMRNERYMDFSKDNVRVAMYRPYSKKYVYFDRIAIDELGQFPTFLPNEKLEAENKVICVTNHSQVPFIAQMVNNIPEVAVGGRPGQSFPFYVYDEVPNSASHPPHPPAPSPILKEGEQKVSPYTVGGDLEGGKIAGYTRRENITDWALQQFRTHYHDDSITKWDIFYYVYGLLHHPAYRERYADNLKRELPRIPFVPVRFDPIPRPLPQSIEEEEQLDPIPRPLPQSIEGIDPIPRPLPQSIEEEEQLDPIPRPLPQSIEEEEQVASRALKSPLATAGGDLEGGQTLATAGGDLEGGRTTLRNEAWAHTNTPFEQWKSSKAYAREMRKDPTPAEDKLWQRIRKKQVHGYKFRRQHAIGYFIADFFCADARLVIEVDGSIHEQQKEYDAMRQAYLESLGLRVLRFTNGEVMQQIDAVVERVGEVLLDPIPQPLPQSLEEEEQKSPLAASGGDLEGGSPAASGGGFWIFSRAGKELADLHLNYESQPRYAGLVWEQSDKPHYRVEKMRPRNKRKIALSSVLKSSLDTSGGDLEGGEITVFDTLQYNNTLTITGIPAAAFAYRLGNRSALEWVIDQYQVKTDKRSGITSDPNGYSDDDQYIVKLVERVIHVSVETVKIVAQLAAWPFREEG